MTTRNLADLYFMQKDWEAALNVYHAAMDAGEQLYRAGLSSESKATEMAENAALYRQAAFAAVRCGETLEALLILERGKTRLLTEALRLRVFRPTHVPDDVWITFERAAGAVSAAQFRDTAMPAMEQDPAQAYTAREQAVRDANAALDAAIEQVRHHAPEFLRPIDLPAIQSLLPDERTAMVAFCITYQGSIGFVLSNHHERDIQVIEMPHFTTSELRHLFAGANADETLNGWLGSYYHYLIERTHQDAANAWKETITDTLTTLGQRLLAPVLSALPSHIQRIIFLPSAELFLFPLHAVPLSKNGTARACDRYVVSYSPSVEVLANVRDKVARGAIPELYAVINPTADPRLPFTPFEGRTIAQLFKQPHVDEGSLVGTRRRVIDGARGHSYVHFSCHGGYNWNEPAASGLALADGPLTLAELQRGVVDLSAARLVTLSACETGISDIMRGSAEEYVGIPAGFLMAGVPCVVSTLWAVPDISTALLMERFYRNHLSGGMDFAAALREAQLWIRRLSAEEVAQYAEQCYRVAKQKEKVELFRLMRYYSAQAKLNPALRPFAHPFYWAAFTVNGT